MYFTGAFPMHGGPAPLSSGKVIGFGLSSRCIAAECSTEVYCTKLACQPKSLVLLILGRFTETNLAFGYGLITATKSLLFDRNKLAPRQTLILGIQTIVTRCSIR